MKKELIVFLSGLCLFFIIPVVLRLFKVPLDLFVLSWISLIYIVYPVFFIVSGLVLCKNIGKTWYMPLLLVTAFSVSVFANRFVPDINGSGLTLYLIYIIQYLFFIYISMLTGYFTGGKKTAN